MGEVEWDRRPPRVLVVDDEADVRGLITYKLTRAGVEVSAAADGFVGLTKARTEGPDLIVMDIWMPDISGIEVCLELHHDPVTRRIPILLLSAVAQERYVQNGLDGGPVYYMGKPFSPSVLVTRVRALLARSRRALPVGAPFS